MKRFLLSNLARRTITNRSITTRGVVVANNTRHILRRRYQPAVTLSTLSSRRLPIQNHRLQFSTETNNRKRYFSTAVYDDQQPPSHPPVPPDAEPPKTKPFNKVLIANRGEIAIRVIKTCQRLGIKTVAVHSTVDATARHVQLADESVCIGPAPSLDSYLNEDAVLAAAKKTNAEAIHPGYGFLSENASFSKRVKDDGLIFIGPGAHAISQMGDKITSKKIAQEAGVNTIPGFAGIIKSEEEAVKISNDIGYPVMIKATAGGGGKGMRICRTDEDVKEGFRLSSVEAAKFFKDDRVFIEKYIENPHHIEFQVLAGRVPPAPNHDMMTANPYPILEGDELREIDCLVFPERECSIQRRNQKVIEESPSVLLLPETRNKMVRQCKALVKAVRYWSAGTVEFLVDEKQNFYFLEMNTRLQVEHPVTELITGVDLVEGMLRVANEEGVSQELLKRASENVEGMGGGLSEEEKEVWKEGCVVPFKGHAIETRVYAEDPFRNFLPSTGPLLSYIEPTSLPNVRIDSGVTSGSVISTYYDPMISKLCSYGQTRDEAIATMSHALDRYVIRGVGHNIPFARSVLRNEEFRSGRTPTSFIPTHYPEGFRGVELTNEELVRSVGIVAALEDLKRMGKAMPRLVLDGTRRRVAMVGGMFGEAFEVMEGEEGLMTVKRLEGEDEREVTMVVSNVKYDPANPIVELTVDGEDMAIQMVNEDICGTQSILMNGAHLDVMIMTPREYELSRIMHEPPVLDTSELVLSPMPGTLISYAVKEGDEVCVGQELCIVEAMKMQNVIRSTRTGIISNLKGEVGKPLRADEIILEYAKEEGDTSDVAAEG